MGGQGGEVEEVKKRKRGREQERSDTKGEKKRGRDGWRDRRTEWKEGKE